MKQQVIKTDSNRILYLDFLRVFAAVAVIVLHVTATNWYHVDLQSIQWTVFNIVNSAVRWCVPVFVMISGAMFLNPDKPVKISKLYRNIFRIVIAFFLWSAIYCVNNIWLGVDSDTVLTLFIVGNYHMWFLYMLMGLYVIVPVLRKITENKDLTEYFLVIGFVFTFFIPRVINLMGCIDNPDFATFVNSISSAFSKMHFHLTLGYVFYFVLGFYLVKYDLSVFVCRSSYVMGGVGYVATVKLTDWYSCKEGYAMETFYSNHSVNVLLMAVGIFLFFKYVVSKIQLKERGMKFLFNFSKYTFGIYLVHAIVIEKFCGWLKINTLTYHPLISIIIISIGVLLISYVISAVLNRIPVLNKYIV